MAEQLIGSTTSTLTFEELLQSISLNQKLIVESIDKLNATLMANARQMGIGSWGLPTTTSWTWENINLEQKGRKPFTLAAGEDIELVSEKDLTFKRGFMHSMGMGISSINLNFDLVAADSTGRKLHMANTFANLRAGAYSELIPAPGMPVVVDRAGLSPTVPQVAVRIPPSYLIPFNTKFSFTVINKTSSAALIYDFDAFFILFE